MYFTLLYKVVQRITNNPGDIVQSSGNIERWIQLKLKIKKFWDPFYSGLTVLWITVTPPQIGKKKKCALKEYEFKRKYPVILSVFKKHTIFTPCRDKDRSNEVIVI